PPGSRLRRDPALDEWVIVAPHRQDRTYRPPPERCPFCPTRPDGEPTEIPVPAFEIAVFENRFPGLSPGAASSGDGTPPDPPALFETAPGRGQGEVVVYTPHHEGSLGALPLEKVERLVRVWTHRYRELGVRPYVRNVFIFENRGEAIGVTLEHPHGQIYGHPLVPPVPARMLEVEARHHRRTGRCLRCDIVAGEMESGDRVIRSSGTVLTHVPFAPRWPYEAHIATRPHRASLLDLRPAERLELAAALKSLLESYDRLFGRPMPYVLAVMQAPTAATPGPGSHLRIEVYPALRAPDRLKHRAGSETAMGLTVTDVLPETAAGRLRELAQ
ncbi:MAG: galactose-1-phosphate uridylyltransferase, partial [Gemmatimonadetes bacterium]|nr:galactose-1-phosphate uridylyltransferase [Gemmatimonadota bacterium]NIQ53752.1 galactose-1-phosphate uridylyltransferase [Gemmatimonadota bacterium]NIU74409.1 galactose-1-phosphate uridylyltransferase [Gammaproteobacteria bacterium]NIX44395.1 galactose-1-phosphate uridylyltransferase [Gemmatimonadota bacterium]NIY08613.1 galactose-1-phosphate uridylyltransferase [Gemmatimonadota bacterium]